MLTLNYAAQVRTASGIHIILGLLLVASPWVFGYHAVGLAALWNSVAVGALIAVLATNRAFFPRVSTGLGWANLLLALWTIASPWIYGYTANSRSLWGNVVLGVVMAALATWGASASTVERHRHHPPRATAH
jgi:hypothetical protein